ncbi:MAG: 16S rRNA (adenine(1518)-N(6)/adenine(1519)-N(6))-dimethyltransferase RsmA [Bacteroidales bacterium]
MDKVTAKKRLGQHFLRDKGIARRVSSSFKGEGCDSVLEIGPGMGVLTEFLLERAFADFRVIEIDGESVNYLKERFGESLVIIEGDFLRVNMRDFFPGTLGIAGNFPYNISSQILFSVLENRDKVNEITGMFQKEVAERICSGPGTKEYGILSVLVQAWYTTEYLFTVPQSVFSPPPKVKSGVIRLTRKQEQSIACDEKLFFRVVKAGFNQRRKMLRNSLRSAFVLKSEDCPWFQLRPEQLDVNQFVALTNWVEKNT